MKHTFLLMILLATPFLAPAAAQQANAPSSNFLEEQGAASDKAREEEEVYTSGQDALGEGAYDDAIKAFDSVIKMHGRKVDAALYWKAYALKKAGNKPQALSVIAELRKSYPKSTWLHDAGMMETEMRGAAVNPENVSDEEEKVMAINALMNSDPEKAVPLLEKIIQGNYSPKLKDKALFVLSQSNSDKAQQIMMSLAKANSNPDLQKRAIRYLGMNCNKGNRAALKQIYNGTSDFSVKKMVFQGWLMCGDKEDVLAVALTEKEARLRKEAIRYLGLMGGRVELRQLYEQTPDLESREELIQAMGIGGDVEGLTQVAKTDKDPVTRRRAIKALGIFGGHSASDTLFSLYGSEGSIETKKEVINALFLNSAGKQMVALARKETDPELKRALISKMSLMSSPEITDYMMEVLNK